MILAADAFIFRGRFSVAIEQGYIVIGLTLLHFNSV